MPTTPPTPASGPGSRYSPQFWRAVLCIGKECRNFYEATIYKRDRPLNLRHAHTWDRDLRWVPSKEDFLGTEQRGATSLT